MRYRYIVNGNDNEVSIHKTKREALKELKRVRNLKKRPLTDYWLERHNISKDVYYRFSF